MGTKLNGHSNGVVNGISGSDSEGELDGSDSENEEKETGLNSQADTPINDAGKTESEDNSVGDIVLTSNSASDSNINELESEETMGPNNESADAVSYDIDLDKSVPELVTEYELLNQGITNISESVVQSGSTFFSSSSSTSSTSVKTSRIPVAVDKKRTSMITRQNTYTVESSNNEEENSSDPIKDVTIVEANSIEDEVDASVGSLLQRQNTYTVKTSEVHQSHKVSQSIKSFTVEESVSSYSKENLQLSLSEPKEQTDEIEETTEKDVGIFKTDEGLNNSQDLSEVPEPVIEAFTETETIVESLTAGVEQKEIVEEVFTEQIISKCGAENTSIDGEKDPQEEDITENIVKEPIKVAVVESAVITDEENPEIETPTESVITKETEENVPNIEEKYSLGAQNTAEVTNLSSEDAEKDIQEADVSESNTEELEVVESAIITDEENPEIETPTESVITKETEENVPTIEEKYSLGLQNTAEVTNSFSEDAENDIQEVDVSESNTEELAVVESAIITVEENHQHEIETPSENVITKVTESDVYENNVEELEQMTVVESAVNEIEPVAVPESANINSREDLQHDTEPPTNNLVPQITIQKQIVAEEHADESVHEEVQPLQEEPEKDLGNVQKETPSNIGEPIQDKTKEIDQSNLSIIKEDISDSLLQKEEEPLYKDPEDALEI